MHPSPRARPPRARPPRARARPGARAAFALSLALLLPACTGGGYALSEDPRANHPLRVVAARASLERPAGTRWEGEDGRDLAAFAADHARRGRGPIEIAAPPADAAAAARALVRLGARAGDLRAAPAAPGAPVSLSFAAHEARPSPCGLFVSDRDSLFALPYNGPSSEFGCSTQNNLAAMVSDPLDLVRPRPAGGLGSGELAAGRVRDYLTYTAPPPPARQGTGGTQGSGG